MQRKEVENKYKFDLEKLYKNEEEYEKDYKIGLERIEELAKYKNKVVKSPEILHEFLTKYYETNSFLNKIYIYGNLLNTIDNSDNVGKKLYTKGINIFSELSKKTAFFENEILDFGYENIQKYLTNFPKLKTYDYFFEVLFDNQKHILSEKEEKILAELSAIGKNLENNRSALLFEDIKFGKIKDENGKYVELTNQNYGKFLSSKNRDVRKKAFKKYYSEINKFKSSFVSILNLKLTNDYRMSKIRDYNDVLDESLDEYKLDRSFINNYLDIINKNKELYKKYNNTLQKILGLKTMYSYDLNYNHFESDKKYSVEEALVMLKEAFNIYGKDYIDIFQNLIDERRIDFIPTDNKSTGAYATGNKLTGSYVFLNYLNRLDDISTLAHEVGHAVQFQITANNNEAVNEEGPLIILETCSILNEIIFSNYFLNNSNHKEEKILIIKNLLSTLFGNFFLVGGRLELQNYI